MKPGKGAMHRMVLHRYIFVLLTGLCYWVWPLVVYFQTGNWRRSALAMGIEILSSGLLLAAFAIVWHWLSQHVEPPTN
jgi:hypothetical protein